MALPSATKRRLLLDNFLLEVFEAGAITIDTFVLLPTDTVGKSRTGTSRQKQVHHLPPPTIRGPGQWCITITVLSLQFCPGVQENTDNISVAIGCRYV
mmetsp:Transcript_12111/g.21267  ORF Transcript_12111/g.21267 Transcript_12111/m.21267 type:complete len:98 (-) Transcript_12111:749-1042(-)